MRPTLTITKALADETRLRAVMALADGELCLCQLVELLGLAPSTVSKHLNVLHEAGLVDRRKEGRWAYFRLAGREASPAARTALRWVREALAQEEQVKRDARAVRAVRRQDLAALCACYDRV